MAITLAILALAVGRWFDALGMLIAPAAWLLPILGPLISETLVRWFIPEGGPAGGVLFIMSCTILFWTAVLAIVYALFDKLRSRLVSTRPPR